MTTPIFLTFTDIWNQIEQGFEPGDCVFRKREVAGADLTISWFFGNMDIPHKMKEVWMSGVEFTRILRFSAKSKYQERLQIWNQKVL